LKKLRLFYFDIFVYHFLNACPKISAMRKKFIYLFFIQFLFVAAFSQTQTAYPKLKGWHLLNYQQDGYFGTGVKEAYELLAGRKSTPVIVAVIDSGIDTLHEDLKSVLWTNPKEIPENGKDDDGNGYTDDIHGWNFCGAANGENMAANTLEIARVYHHWKTEFVGKEESDIPANKKFLFQQWKRSEALLDKQYYEYLKSYSRIENLSAGLQAASQVITTYLNKAVFTKSDIVSIDDSDSLNRAVAGWLDIFKRAGDSGATNTLIISEISKYKGNLLANKSRKDDIPVDYRGALTKDDYENINDSVYGNNNLFDHAGNHGTHVSGIIGAVRNNNKGVDGIVDNVRIMFIRAVPGGDEHDKDVALAIRYAVDNGAKIINMSFGKPVSPYKQMVDDAVKYADEAGVLLVHGAGNDGEDIDKNPFYPNAVFLNGTKATNFLTIGASGDYSTGSLVASFSNYGQLVDIFAPGVYINSTTFSNGYEAFDGTSMASPVAAGVAGLIKSYFPNVTPEQMIDLLIKTGTPVTELVTIPGGDTKVAMQVLCSSGKIINAYKAAKLAIKLYGNK
jgi:subtilisin family serine protease